MTIQQYQTRCFNEYKRSVGLSDDYSFFYGNPVNVLVPIETAVNGVMIIGAYPSAKFATINRITDVPLYDNDSPFSSESYFDGSRVRSIPSGKELEDNYLAPLGIKRSQCWITDLVKVFLFKEGHILRYRKLGMSDRIETRSKFKELAIKSISWLIDEVKIAEPKVIILLGIEVTSILFGISDDQAKSYLDGEIREITLGENTCKALCLPHPGIIMKPSLKNPWPERFRTLIIPKSKEKLKVLGF